MKKCPFCAESIQDEAGKCKHCGSMLGRGSESGSQNTSPTSAGVSGSTARRDALDMQATAFGLRPELTLQQGRYRLVRELGRGGMGVVWLAHDGRLDMDAAIKFLPPELCRDARGLRELSKEARLSMQLTHPNIVRLYNLEESDGLAYLVMEYVDGPTLEGVVQEKGKLSVEETLRYAEGLCAGLGYAHGRAVVHLDLKPSNVMLTREGEVKIADFGIARRIRDGMTRVTKQETSGTLLYMSPEQLMGEKLDHRSDLYSLGALLYELLSGTPPFTTGNIPTQIQFKSPGRIEGVPDRVNDALQTLLAKKPEDRPNSATSAYARLTSTASIQAALPEVIEAVARPQPEPKVVAVPRKKVLEAFFPMTSEEARAVQRAAAEALGLPVEKETDLGGGVKLEMVFIPAGSFQMGSPDSEEGRFDKEGPVHTVRITKPFYMGKYEVTQGQWKKVMGSNPSHFKGGGRLPVETVSWNDCQDFVRRAGNGLRLPTEAEWEHACRAGTNTRFSFGDSDRGLDRYAWYDGNSFAKTHEVGTKRPNAWGLYDMHGNVWEWCQSLSKRSYPYGENDGRENLNDGGLRVLRGGSWIGYPRRCRSAFRNGDGPSDSCNGYGFRVVVAVQKF